MKVKEMLSTLKTSQERQLDDTNFQSIDHEAMGTGNEETTKEKGASSNGDSRSTFVEQPLTKGESKCDATSQLRQHQQVMGSPQVVATQNNVGLGAHGIGDSTSGRRLPYVVSASASSASSLSDRVTTIPSQRGLLPSPMATQFTTLSRLHQPHAHAASSLGSVQPFSSLGGLLHVPPQAQATSSLQALQQLESLLAQNTSTARLSNSNVFQAPRTVSSFLHQTMIPAQTSRPNSYFPPPRSTRALAEAQLLRQLFVPQNSSLLAVAPQDQDQSQLQQLLRDIRANIQVVGMLLSQQQAGVPNSNTVTLMSTSANQAPASNLDAINQIAAILSSRQQSVGVQNNNYGSGSTQMSTSTTNQMMELLIRSNFSITNQGGTSLAAASNFPFPNQMPYNTNRIAHNGAMPKVDFGSYEAAASQSAPQEDSNLSKEARWMMRYEELKQFKQKHGHCRVPHGFADNKKLSWWVMNQRAQFSLLKQGKSSWLSEDRVELLKDLGFDWIAVPKPKNKK